MRKLMTAVILVLALAAMMGAAWAEEEPTVYTSGDYEYVLLEDGTAEIVKYRGSAMNLIVADMLDGYRVTSIGDRAFYSRNSLTIVTIPDGVTNIGDYAFAQCYMSLNRITIPDSVTNIGDYTFEGCNALTSITIPNSVMEIGANPFRYCEQLTNIIVSVDHSTLATIDGVLVSKPDNRLVCYPYAFTGTKYTIPQEIQIIGDSAFDNCYSLISITIPDSVTSIGNSAFAVCKSLTSMTIPDSVISIGDYAFSSCYALTSMTIPDGVTSIGDHAFNLCDSLTRVTIPDSVTEIGANPFKDCNQLTGIIVSADHPTLAIIDGVLFSKPDNRLVCCTYAFTKKEYTIPDGVTSIGDYAFNRCRALTGITIPDGVTHIGNHAFDLCTMLTSVTIPDSVTSIGNYAFYCCYSLASISIPDSVTHIGDAAFSGYPVSFTVTPGAYAETWCKQHERSFTYAGE